MRFICASIGALFLAGPVAAETVNCSLTAEIGGPISPYQFFEYNFVPAMMKSICGLPVDDEQSAIRKHYQSLGCGPDTPVGQSIEADISALGSDIDISALGLSRPPDLTSLRWRRACALASVAGVSPMHRGAVEAVDADTQSDSQLSVAAPNVVKEQQTIWRELFSLLDEEQTEQQGLRLDGDRDE